MTNIVTESKLESLMFKYLDMKLEGVEERKGKYVDIVFVVPGEKIGLLGWEKTGILYTHSNLSINLKDFFELELFNTLDVIGRYVKGKYNLEVNNTNIALIKLFVFS